MLFVRLFVRVRVTFTILRDLFTPNVMACYSFLDALMKCFSRNERGLRVLVVLADLRSLPPVAGLGESGEATFRVLARGFSVKVALSPIWYRFRGRKK